MSLWICMKIKGGISILCDDKEINDDNEMREWN